MEQRSIGRTDLVTSRIGMGCVTFGREIDETTSFRILDHAVGQGITFLDSSEAYGGGNSQAGRRSLYDVDDQREVTTEMHSSEMILGRWLRRTGAGSDLVICTKVASGATPDNIRRQVQASLDRLGVDRIDVYKIHNPDPNVPIAESLDALNGEVEAGRITAIGCSNVSADQMAEALEASRSHGFARFEITQPPYSLADRRAEDGLLDLCAREEIAVTAYSPLAAGFLAGKYAPTNDRQHFPKGSRFDISPAHADVYFSDHNFEVVDRLRRKAEELDQPMVRLAMAWALTQPQVTAVLVGARKLDHVDNAIEALEMGMDESLREEMSAW
ncbi:MAG: hypothetical protein CMJ18_15435 [Phycisphaeraceae bacterium]|nr:hypothetical protein [Phycisphaeraceae bacterium]